MIRHAPAKVNIFLKITGARGAYHELRSRFMLVESLYDIVKFVKKGKKSDGFELFCNTSLPKNNTLVAAFKLLEEKKPQISNFFKEYAVVVEKSIPQGAGLGGGSSDAAAFLNLCNEVCDLGISKESLALIAEKIGADVPFFVYGYRSANVEGIGEKIEPFKEEPLSLHLTTPPVQCDTGAVYRAFRENFFDKVSKDAAKEWLNIPSETLLDELSPIEANDLFAPSLSLYPNLEKYADKNRFFSGSGSTFFEKI